MSNRQPPTHSENFPTVGRELKCFFVVQHDFTLLLCEIVFTFFYALMYANNFPYLLRALFVARTLSLSLAHIQWKDKIYACSENVNSNQVGNKCRIYIYIYVCRDEDYILLPVLYTVAVAVVSSFCFARMPPLTLNGTRFSFPLDNFTK